MTAVDMASAALLTAGVLVVVVSGVLSVLTPHFFDRQHLVTPVTSVGAPLVGLAIAVNQGANLTTGLVLLIIALLAVSGPVLEAATGRVAAQSEGIVAHDEPE